MGWSIKTGCSGKTARGGLKKGRSQAFGIAGRVATRPPSGETHRNKIEGRLPRPASMRQYAGWTVAARGAVRSD